jgi:histone-lysine N-methyltransferase SETMAR
VKGVIAKDRKKSIDDIADTVGLYHGTVHKIVTKDLNMNKVCARWVPRLLTDENKATRVDASREFLRRYDRDGERFLRRIITTNETWVNFYDPESKRESMVRKRPSSPPPKKAKTCKSTKKVMYIFFMDSQGMLLQHASINYVA